MSRLVIFGASDDLIEARGAFDEEFNHYDQQVRVTVNVNGGPLATLVAEYDETGEWKFVGETGRAFYVIVPARGEDEGDDEDGCPGYSEKVVFGNIDGPVTVTTEAAS